jgi:hypothetical protein
VDLVSQYNENIAELYFVSNAEFDEVTDTNTDDTRRGRCPRLFLKHVSSCELLNQIAAPFAKVFDQLQARCACDDGELFAALKRMNLIQGPSRSDFDAVISNQHLSSLKECESLTTDQLNSFRDKLVAMVYRASSLQVEDPGRHLRSLIKETSPDPTVRAKRILVADVAFDPRDTAPVVFEFPGKPRLGLGKDRSPQIIEQKLTRGGLAPEIEHMREMERAAEYNLLEDVERRPDLYPQLQRQIEQMVLQECGEAYLRVRTGDEPFGPEMLIDVQDRLRRPAKERPEMIGHQPYECLIGVAAMLSSECLVWWSSRFPVTV